MTENNENNALAVANTNTGIQTNDQVTGFVPETFEQFEMIKELQKATAEIEGLGQEMAKSQDLIGVPFTILDAWTVEITENGEPKDVVVFKLLLSDTNEEICTMKNANKVNLTYVRFFSNWKAVSKPQVLEGYTFKAEPKYSKAGNDAIILAKQPKQIKSVNKAGGK